MENNYNIYHYLRKLTGAMSEALCNLRNSIDDSFKEMERLYTEINHLEMVEAKKKSKQENR